MKNPISVWWVGVVLFSLGMGMQVDCLAQEKALQEPAAKTAGPPPLVVHAFALKHVEATSALRMLEPLVTEKGIRLSADDRRNLLIAAGSREAIASLRDLLEEIDVEAKVTPRKKTVVYRISNANANDVASVMQQLYGRQHRRELIFVSEEVTNSIVVSCDESDHAAIADLIKRFDVSIAASPEAESKSENIVIRVTWLVDDSEQTPEMVSRLRAPSPTLGKLIAALRDSESVKNAKLVTQAQTTVMVDPSARSGVSFKCTSLRVLGEKSASLHGDGQVKSARDGQYELNLALRLADDSSKLEVVSTVLIPKDHPVAFSIADVGSFKSVVVVEVLDAQ